MADHLLELFMISFKIYHLHGAATVHDSTVTLSLSLSLSYIMHAQTYTHNLPVHSPSVLVLHAQWLLYTQHSHVNIHVHTQLVINATLSFPVNTAKLNTVHYTIQANESVIISQNLLTRLSSIMMLCTRQLWLLSASTLANCASMERWFTFLISLACNPLHYVIAHNSMAFVSLPALCVYSNPTTCT